MRRSYLPKSRKHMTLQTCMRWNEPPRVPGSEWCLTSLKHAVCTNQSLIGLCNATGLGATCEGLAAFTGFVFPHKAGDTLRLYRFISPTQPPSFHDVHRSVLHRPPRYISGCRRPQTPTQTSRTQPGKQLHQHRLCQSSQCHTGGEEDGR